MNRNKWILDATERIEDILSESSKNEDTWELLYHLLMELGFYELDSDTSDEGGRYFYIDGDTRFKNGWYYDYEKQDLINWHKETKDD